MTEYSHISVLPEEALFYLNVQKGKKYIDATLGGGGHSLLISKKGGLVLGLDCDPNALLFVQSLNIPNLKAVLGNFRNLESIAKENHFENVSGVLFDLGMSSFQIEASSRGFSFRSNEPLDMRMDPELGVTAADLLNALSRKELQAVLTEFGDERLAGPISLRIVEARKSEPFATSNQLAGLVEKVYQSHRVKEHRIHPATRSFQAIRIAVNDELPALRLGLDHAIELLSPGGRLVVISFHSLEDRIAKDLRNDSRLTEITQMIRPSKQEIIKNKRAGSAKMRVYEKK